MRRRDFLRNAAGGATLGALGASSPTLATAAVPQACAEAAFPQIQKVTAHVVRVCSPSKVRGHPRGIA